MEREEKAIVVISIGFLLCVGGLEQLPIFFYIFLLGLILLFIQYYSVICRPQTTLWGRDSNPGRAAQRQGHYP